MLATLHTVLSYVPGGIPTLLGFALELGLRRAPTEKKLSILYGLRTFANVLAEVSQAIGDALDRIVPQNVTVIK